MFQPTRHRHTVRTAIFSSVVDAHDEPGSLGKNAHSSSAPVSITPAQWTFASSTISAIRIGSTKTCTVVRDLVEDESRIRSPANDRWLLRYDHMKMPN